MSRKKKVITFTVGEKTHNAPYTRELNQALRGNTHLSSLIKHLKAISNGRACTPAVKSHLMHLRYMFKCAGLVTKSGKSLVPGAENVLLAPYITFPDLKTENPFQTNIPQGYCREYHEGFVYSDANWSSKDAHL